MTPTSIIGTPLESTHSTIPTRLGQPQYPLRGVSSADRIRQLFSDHRTFPLATLGIIEALTTRRASMPCTRPSPSTTAMSSFPMRHVQEDDKALCLGTLVC